MPSIHEAIWFFSYRVDVIKSCVKHTNDFDMTVNQDVWLTNMF